MTRSDNGAAMEGHLCVELVCRFFGHLDADRYDDLMALMVPGAIWYRQGAELSPGNAMLAVLRRRSPNRVVAHLLTNLVATPSGMDSMSVSGYMLAFAHDGGGSRTLPAPLDMPTSISLLNTELVRSGDRWLLHRSRTTPLFKREAA